MGKFEYKTNVKKGSTEKGLAVNIAQITAATVYIPGVWINFCQLIIHVVKSPILYTVVVAKELKHFSVFPSNRTACFVRVPLPPPRKKRTNPPNVVCSQIHE